MFIWFYYYKSALNLIIFDKNNYIIICFNKPEVLKHLKFNMLHGVYFKEN